MVRTYYMYDRAVTTCIQAVKKNTHKIKISIRSDIWYITGSDKWNRKKTITKMVQQLK